MADRILVILTNTVVVACSVPCLEVPHHLLNHTQQVTTHLLHHLPRCTNQLVIQVPQISLKVAGLVVEVFYLLLRHQNQRKQLLIVAPQETANAHPNLSVVKNLLLIHRLSRQQEDRRRHHNQRAEVQTVEAAVAIAVAMALAMNSQLD